jgi:hypothetical protein
VSLCEKGPTRNVAPFIAPPSATVIHSIAGATT